MKKCLAIVAVCLMAAPAMAGEVSDGTLSNLGLSGMQTMSDAQGMQVRGKASAATVSGTSLIFGQLVADLPTGTNFVVGSDVNHYWSEASNTIDHSLAQGQQGSALNLTLGPILIDDLPAYSGSLLGFAGAAIPMGGFANAWGTMSATPAPWAP